MLTVLPVRRLGGSGRQCAFFLDLLFIHYKVPKNISSPVSHLPHSQLPSVILLISAQVEMANQWAIPPTDRQGHHVVQSYQYECRILKYSSCSRSHLLQIIPALLSNRTYPCTSRMNILPSRIATVPNVLQCGALKPNHGIGTQLSNMIQDIPE